jgi:hypothetical protein
MRHRIFRLLALLSLTACMSVGPAAWFGAQQNDRASNAVISAWTYFESVESWSKTPVHSGLLVTAINGKSVGGHTSYLVVPPGKYKISMIMTMQADDLHAEGYAARRWSREVEIDARAGHTYRPSRAKDGNQALLYVDDKGLDYPVKCLLLVSTQEIGGETPPEC